MDKLMKITYFDAFNYALDRYNNLICHWKIKFVSKRFIKIL